MASVHCQQNALDALEASLNAIFLQIGATFSSPKNLESAHLPRAKAQLQLTLPKEKLAFDDALDQLEYELNHAKSVLLRDMTAIQSQRVKQKSVESKPNLTNGVTLKAQESVSPEVTKKAILKESTSPDVVMDDAVTINGSATTDEARRSREVNTSTALPNGIATADQFSVVNPAAFEPGVAVANNTVQNGISQNGATPAGSLDNAGGSGDNDELDSLFMQDDTKSTNGVNNDMAANQQDNDVNSLLPGLEFYANENSATPGALDGLGDMGGSILPDSGAALGLSNGNDSSALMNGTDGQNSMFDSDFDYDTWLANAGGQPAGEHVNAEQAQFDSNFFSLD